jgi:hypothetical protein
MEKRDHGEPVKLRIDQLMPCCCFKAFFQRREIYKATESERYVGAVVGERVLTGGIRVAIEFAPELVGGHVVLLTLIDT